MSVPVSSPCPVRRVSASVSPESLGTMRSFELAWSGWGSWPTHAETLASISLTHERYGHQGGGGGPGILSRSSTHWGAPQIASRQRAGSLGRWTRVHRATAKGGAQTSSRPWSTRPGRPNALEAVNSDTAHFRAEPHRNARRVLLRAEGADGTRRPRNCCGPKSATSAIHMLKRTNGPNVRGLRKEAPATRARTIP
jgi:hypothetical protein